MSHFGIGGDIFQSVIVEDTQPTALEGGGDGTGDLGFRFHHRRSAFLQSWRSFPVRRQPPVRDGLRPGPERRGYRLRRGPLASGHHVLPDVDVSDIDRHDFKRRLIIETPSQHGFGNDVLDFENLFMRFRRSDGTDNPFADRAMIVSSVAPPIKRCKFARTRDARFDPQLDSVLATASKVGREVPGVGSRFTLG